MSPQPTQVQALVLFVTVASDASRLHCQKGLRRRPRCSRSKLMETKMRVISQNELSYLTRRQLYSLLVQVQATLSGQPEGSPEYSFLAETLSNIRAVLSRKAPAP